MSGSAGRLRFEKQEDKHQGWTSIHIALEEFKGLVSTCDLELLPHVL